MRAIFDETWRRQALDGHAPAVELLAVEMLQPLYRFCLYRLGRDRHLCEDVVQETLVRALRQLDQYDPKRSGGDIFSWLVGLARNEVRRALASRPTAAKLEQLWMNMDRHLLSLYASLESEPLAQELLDREETAQMVNAAMSQLPPNYARALEAKYLLGHSVRQIAEAWKTSEKAVESLLSRARQAFRDVFLTLTQNLQAPSDA